MEKVKDKFIELAGNIGEGIGLNRSVCQIYALLYFSSSPLSLTEISKYLGISKGNVSMNLKKLEDWNAVKRVWKKGYTRPFYIANEDIEGIMLQKLKTGIKKRIEMIKNVISEVNSSSRLNKRLKNKIKRIEELVEKMEMFADNVSLLEKL